VKEKIPNDYQIFAGDSPYFKINGYVSVTVEGKPDDSVVDFKLCTEDKKGRSLHASPLLELMFIGGYFLKKRLKAEEECLKLEKEFWKHAENAVLQLSNSATNSVY